DAAVDEERRGEAGVDDGAHVELVARPAAHLFDHEGVVALAHQLLEQGPHLLGDQGRVISLDEIGGGRPRHAHAASLTAASASRARQVPLTSCTRTMRQPQAMPRAAAPMEASRRSVSSKSRIFPRNVLLEAERSSGYPSEPNAGEPRSKVSDCSAVLPRSRPASSTIRPGGIPASPAWAARSSRKRDTSRTTSS